jgi:hypothetical protein
MSAIITLRQREAVHLVCDGCGYDADGIVRAIMSKAIAIPHLSAVISTRGSAVALPFIATRLSTASSFDELISVIEAELPKIMDDAETFFEMSGATSTEMAVIGWSDQDDCGKAFTIQTGNASDTRDEYADAEQPEPYKLIERRADYIVPAPSAEIMSVAAHGFLDVNIEKLVPAVDLLQIMEMQRQSLVEYNDLDIHIVGGLALLSTVTRGGVITQRVIHRWPEDKIGQDIQPESIDDWKQWRTDLIIKNAGGSPVGMSRLRREMFERKAHKGTLRAA